MLVGIWSLFWCPYWLYVMLMSPWKWPGFDGDSVMLKFLTFLADMFSINSVSMNDRSDLISISVIVSLPKLKSWIISWDSVSANVSAKRSSGSWCRSSCVLVSITPFACRYTIGIENLLYDRISAIEKTVVGIGVISSVFDG